MAFRYEMTGPGPDRVIRTEGDPVAPVPFKPWASSLNFHDLVSRRRWLAGGANCIDAERI